MEPIKTSNQTTLLDAEPREDSDEAEGEYQHKYVTVPNVICTIRLMGAIWLFWLAIQNSLVLFTSVFVVLNLSD